MVTIIKKGTGKADIKKALDSVNLPKGINAFKYCGKVQLNKDPLVIQKRLRNEWE